MKKGENYNRPKKGCRIKAEPIRDTKDIKSIKKLLSDNPRNYALFTIGINTNLRAGDLCRITASTVRNLKPLDEIEIKEQKTGKSRRITLNKACVDAINRLLASKEYRNTDRPFKGQRGPIVT